MLTIGGDHTIALPMLRALARDHGKIAVLHFDAHLDTWDTYFGAPYTHGTPFRRASEEGLLDMERCLHMGIRGPLYCKSGSRGRRAARLPGHPVRRLRNRRCRSALSTGCATASATARSMCPSTSTCSTRRTRRAPARPEAGGLTSRELLNTLRGLVGLNVVGADIVEVAPAYDHAEITGIAAAHVGYELLSVLAANR